MTVTILTVLSIAVIVLIGGIILVTVTFSRSLQRAVDHADRVHNRSTDTLQTVLDRLMAKNFEEFKTYDLGESGHGEMIIPDSPAEDRPWNVPGVTLPGAGLWGGAVELGEEDTE